MESKLKGVSFTQRFRKRLSLHNLGLVGSTVSGITKWGGSTSPTLPQTEIAPVANLSSIVRDIKPTKGLQEI